LVVPAAVERDFAQEFAVFAEHSDVQVEDEDQHFGSGVPAADADVVEPAVVPDRRDTPYDAARDQVMGASRRVQTAVAGALRSESVRRALDGGARGTG
jgi:hypothetical protein